MKTKLIFASALALFMAGGAQAQSQDDKLRTLMERIEQQQRQIDELRKELVTTREQLETTAEAVEQSANEPAESGLSGTSLGAYGELHYNGGNKDQIDFHRFVIFLGHEFTDDLRFFGEVEIEHSLAGEGKPGEVEIEQAFIEYDLNDFHRAKAGLFLLPVGILNETHEPSTFYGVERNPVESNIIPTTWWEAGAGLAGSIAPGWSYDVAIHSGLEVPVAGGSAFKIRSGRQKVAEATATDFATTGRVRYTGIAGLELAASLQYQQNVTQGVIDDASATLFTTHAVWQRGPWGLRALYARWDIGSDEFEAAGADEQDGWYVEPSFRVNEQLGLFARHAAWNTRAGGNGDDSTESTVGVNFWLHEHVVLKADYQWQNDEAGDDDRINLGVGYTF